MGLQTTTLLPPPPPPPLLLLLLTLLLLLLLLVRLPIRTSTSLPAGPVLDLSGGLAPAPAHVLAP
jgi:hypothetical protein